MSCRPAVSCTDVAFTHLNACVPAIKDCKSEASSGIACKSVPGL